MRFVIYGAGAVGGVIGGRLWEHGHDVVLIGRGKQLAAIREHGLRVESPGGSTTYHLPIAEAPSQLVWSADDVVLLTMKTQDTSDALRDLAASAPSDVPVVCTQNGVENERLALRHVPRRLSHAGRRSGVEFPGVGVARHWTLPIGSRRNGPSHCRCSIHIDLPVGSTLRHHAVEVRQASDESWKCH